MIQVVVVDDHPIVRAGMRAILDAATDIVVVAEGVDGFAALSLVAEHHPDVLILDLNLPGINGLEVAQRLCQQNTATAILALTAHDDRETIFGLLECGAIGYVLKDEALETLVNAVRAAARGESWLSPGVASQVVKAAFQREKGLQTSLNLSGHPDDDSDLTAREHEVLSLLSQGLDNAAIAERLVVTKRTVQNHVSNIYSKLGVASRPEAMLYAIRRGWVDVAPTGDAFDEV